MLLSIKIWKGEFQLNILSTLIESDKLELRKSTKDDIDYILELTSKPENSKFIVRFPRARYEKALESEDEMAIIIVEKSSGDRVGYFLVAGLKTHSIEWTHVVIDKKGVGYGHESLKLLKAWSFGVKKFHRGWLDCKDYNDRALHLYESEGLIREGIERDVLKINDKFETLVIFSMLENEYEDRKQKKLEVDPEIILRAQTPYEFLT